VGRGERRRAGGAAAPCGKASTRWRSCRTGRVATGGQDGRVAIWRHGAAEPERTIAAHDGPVAALAVSPDGGRIATAGWDGAAKLFDLGTGTEVTLRGHVGPVNGVGFLPGGGAASAGYDGTLRFWDADGTARGVARTPGGAERAGGRAGRAGLDGGRGREPRLFGPEGEALAEIATGSAPVVSLALGKGVLAAGGLDGRVTLVDAAEAWVLRVVEAGAGPVWAVALAGGEVLAGRADGVVRAWDVATGTPLATSAEAAAERFGGSRGPEVFRACAACHALGPEEGPRAGPTLHGIFGRRIGTAEGYDFSPALQGMGIVWTPETVAELFEVGPSRYTPGTKMPEQRIGSAADRAA
jgi:cytochrome c